MEQRVKCLLSGCVHNDCNLLWSCYQFLVNLTTLFKQVKSWNLVKTGQYSLGTTSRHGWGNNSKSQCGSNILSTHIPFVPCQSALPFLTYSIFKIWPSKSRVKVMGEVTIQSHNVGLTSYRLTSLLFHVNRPSHSWVMTFFKIWPWNSKVKVMGEVTVQSHNVGLTSYRHTFLLFYVNWPSHSWNTASSKFDLENQGSRSNDPDVAQLQV